VPAPSEHEPDAGLGEVDREVLSKCDHGRTAGDIRFLLAGTVASEVVDRSLTGLVQGGLVVCTNSPRGAIHARTGSGDEVLRKADDWEYVVDEVFRVDLRPRPLVVGRVLRGRLFSGDWFMRDGDVGRVVSIEFSPRGRGQEDQLTITTDLDVCAGDRLNRFSPVAATNAPVESE
jgi:hypothetical protein